MDAPAGSPDASFDLRRPAQHPHTLVVRLAGRFERSDATEVASIVAEHLRRRPARTVICEVGYLVAPGAAAVDAVCRIRLGVRRLGGRLRLRHASPALLDLIDLMGLCDVLSARARSGIETRR